MRTAGQGIGGEWLEPEGPLPVILERAQQDRQWQLALAKLGYRQVKAAYVRQMRAQPKADIFYGLEHVNQFPTVEFVRAWMKAQRKRILKRLSWTFLGAMLATIVAVITFAVSCQCIAAP